MYQSRNNFNYLNYNDKCRINQALSGSIEFGQVALLGTALTSSLVVNPTLAPFTTAEVGLTLEFVVRLGVEGFEADGCSVFFGSTLLGVEIEEG